MIKYLIGFCLTYISTVSFGQDTAFCIANSTVKKIPRDSVYQLNVFIPRSTYDSTKKGYPVIYVLDGQWNFATTVSLCNGLVADGAMPEAIIVGITWSGTAPNYDSLREAAYTILPTAAFHYGGNAHKFLSDIKHILIPFIDSAYHTDTMRRVLIGGSLGASFTAYACLHAPEMFRAFVMASPAFVSSNENLLDQIKGFTPHKFLLPVKLFIGIGQDDHFISTSRKFIDAFKARNIKNLELSSDIFPNTGHAACIATSIGRGLRYAFEKKEVDLAIKQLKKYVGIYTASEGDQFPLFLTNRKLMIKYDSSTVFHLRCENLNQFFIKGVPLNFDFTRFSNGRIKGVSIQFASGETYFEKIR